MKTIPRELLGYEGVKDRLGHQGGPKTHREIFTLVWEIITSKEQHRYRWNHKMRGKGQERENLLVFILINFTSFFLLTGPLASFNCSKWRAVLGLWFTRLQLSLRLKLFNTLAALEAPFTEVTFCLPLVNLFTPCQSCSTWKRPYSQK